MPTLVDSQLSVAVHAEQIQQRGYAVIDNVLDRSQISTAKSALNAIFEREKRLRSKATHNDQHQISFVLQQKNQVFRELCQLPMVLQLVRQVLGNDCVIGAMNGFTPQPGCDAQPLHVDLHCSPGLVGSVLVMLTLDDFTRDNGCTRVVPHSQCPDLPVENSNQVRNPALEQRAIYLEAPAGSLIAYDGDLVHGASRNVTRDLRRCLHIQYCRRWVRPDWDMSASLSTDFQSSLTADELKLFGISNRSARYDARTGAESQELVARSSLGAVVLRYRSKLISLLRQ